MYKIIGKHKISPIVGDEIDLLNLSAKDISIIENDDLLLRGMRTYIFLLYLKK